MAKYVYLNVNPEKARISDCVCRAITLATGLDYDEVQDKLYLTAHLFDCDKLTLGCYSNLLDYVFKFKRVDCEGLTVGEFADIYNIGTYLVRCPGHLTCVIDGKDFDTFYCLDYIVTDVWKVD